MIRTWRVELLRLAAFALLGAVSGALFGWPMWGLLIGVLAYILVVLTQAMRLESWLRNGAKISKAPDSFGPWDRIIQHVYDLKQRARQRKKRLSDILGRFHRFTEAIPDATVLLKRNGEIEWANVAARVMLGIRNPQDRGHRIDQLLRDPKFLRYYLAARFDEPLEMASPVDEDVELSVRIVPYGRNERLLTARDTSAQRRIQESRRDFVANVSHELRTPLTVITGYLETILADPELPADLRQHLASMQAQSQRMQTLVSDLLTLSRLEMESQDEHEQESVRVAELAESVCADARRLGEDHPIECVADPQLRLLGQGNALRSAFSNLVVNAVQHTPPGTRITVRWARTGAGAVFSVADQGPGIERKHLGRLTERFYRIDRSRSRVSGGTGLGLAIVKHILERHQAYLEIDSHPGQGTVFTCHFPVQRIEGPKAVPLKAVINP